MGKWISEFLPNRFGSYLVKYDRVPFSISGSSTYTIYTHRLDYDPSNDRWYDRNRVFFPKQYILEWWDEYGITESKKKIKLKF